ncbi:uncharacterized protein PV09_04325 [Verruconis gallopava]|uniref:Uncharacterized protein n=1 Tax=Verruconis gallopava TaxID=253628 RepID=A0A0D2ADP0_9PEZI|nr:uncharacterized protein PV09_04325 [Verruconis gallopava]KIW04575.1 hypothetical protein PV09_04325 [Verruconis gallopava]
MAPVIAETAAGPWKRELLKRQTCYTTYYGGVRCYNSSWYNWGRWVLLGVIILLFILTLFCLSWTSRRRRARGRRPMYGTGWMSQGPLAPPPYQPPPPAPAYTPYPQNDNYGPTPPKPTYGGNQSYPMNDYGNTNTYAPPAGPPPGQYR